MIVDQSPHVGPSVQETVPEQLQLVDDGGDDNQVKQKKAKRRHRGKKSKPNKENPEATIVINNIIHIQPTNDDNPNKSPKATETKNIQKKKQKKAEESSLQPQLANGNQIKRTNSSKDSTKDDNKETPSSKNNRNKKNKQSKEEKEQKGKGKRNKPKEISITNHSEDSKGSGHHAIYEHSALKKLIHTNPSVDNIDINNNNTNIEIDIRPVRQPMPPSSNGSKGFSSTYRRSRHV